MQNHLECLLAKFHKYSGPTLKLNFSQIMVRINFGTYWFHRVPTHLSRTQSIALVGFDGSGEIAVLKVSSGLYSCKSTLKRKKNREQIGQQRHLCAAVGDIIIWKTFRCCVAYCSIESSKEIP